MGAPLAIRQDIPAEELRCLARQVTDGQVTSSACSAWPMLSTECTAGAPPARPASTGRRFGIG